MRYVFPKRIVYTEGQIENPESLLKEKVLQIGLYEYDCAVINGNSSIILDFGKELSGGVRIITKSADPSEIVRLRFGESVGETCAEIGEKNATNDHSVRDMNVRLVRLSDMTFGQTGFRFLRIDFPEKSSFARLRNEKE